MIVTRPTLLAAILAAALLPLPANADTELPQTISRVWFRAAKPEPKPGKRKFATRTGDLTISETGIEFVGNKRTIELPWERVNIVSLGRLKTDVDTEWILLGLADPPGGFVSIRDGRRMGFGQRTGEIHAILKGAMRQLGVAQYDAPDGYRAVEAMERQCALAIPERWTPHVESLVFVGDTVRGTIIFSEETILRPAAVSSSLEPAPVSEVLERVIAGRTPALWVERRKATKGMRCSGLGDSARRELQALADSDPLLGEGREVLEGPIVEDVAIGGCAGLRIHARSRDATDEEARLELRAVAEGETLFVFGMRAAGDRYDSFRETFETVLSTIRFPVRP